MSIAETSFPEGKIVTCSPPPLYPTLCTTTVEGLSLTTSCAPGDVSASFAVKLLGVTWNIRKGRS